MKRFLKYFLGSILVLVAVAILLFGLLYIPGIQNYVRKRAEKYVASEMGMVLQIERFSLHFPLKVGLEGVFFGESLSDTLVSADKVEVSIGLSRILRKELIKSRIRVNNTFLYIQDDSTGMELKIASKELLLELDYFHINKREIHVDLLHLENSKVLFVGGNDTDKATSDTLSSSVEWNIFFNRLLLDTVSYEMKLSSLPFLSASVVNGVISNGEVNIGEEYVAVDSLWLSGGSTILQLRESIRDEEPSLAGESDTSTEWAVRVKSLLLENYSFDMNTAEGDGFILALAGITVQLDRVAYQGEEIEGALRQLKVTDRNSGGRITGMRADVELKDSLTKAGDVYLKTPSSEIRLNAYAETSVGGLVEQAPLNLTLSGRIGMSDVALFWQEIPDVLRDEYVDVVADLAYGKGQIEIDTLQLDMPRRFSVAMQGEINAMDSLPDIEGQLHLIARIDDVDFLFDSLQGVSIPSQTYIVLDADAESGNVRSELSISYNGGKMGLYGEYDISSTAYAGEVKLDHFDLGDFILADSLGRSTAYLSLEGQGVKLDQMKGRLNLAIDSLEYSRHNYHDITLEAKLEYDTASVAVISNDSSLLLNLFLTGSKRENFYTAQLGGEFTRIDFRNLNFLEDELLLSMGIDVKVMFEQDRKCYLDLDIRKLRMGDSLGYNHYGDLSVHMDSETDYTNIQLLTGDFNMVLKGDTIFPQLVKEFQLTGKEVQKQIIERTFNMDSIHQHLPDFSCSIDGGTGNVFGSILKEYEAGYSALKVNIKSSQIEEFSASLVIEHPKYEHLGADTVSFAVFQEGALFRYGLNIINPLYLFEDACKVKVYGEIEDEHISVNLLYENCETDTVIDYGMRLGLNEDFFSLSVSPERTLFHKKRWTVNEGNYLRLYKDRRMEADLRLSEGIRKFNLTTPEGMETEMQPLKIDIYGIDLEAFSEFITLIPDMSGILNIDLLLYRYESHFAAEGSVDIDEFYYERKRVGDVGFDMSYNAGPGPGDHSFGLVVKLDEETRISASGQVTNVLDTERINGLFTILDFPISVIDAFLPEGIGHLYGSVKGEIRVNGVLNKPEISGEISFNAGSIELDMVGATFRLDSIPILLKNGKLLFNHFKIIAPNNEVLEIKGDIELLPLDRMFTNIEVTARKFQLIDSKKSEYSLLYGRAYADIDLYAHGPLNTLILKGNIALLNNTVANFIIPEAALSLKDRSSGIVQFISFDDTLLTIHRYNRRESRTGISVDAFIHIGENVQVNVNLSDDGNNYASVKGGGELNFIMNKEDGMILSGRYTLSGGEVRYAIPVIGVKTFAIKSGSFIEWTGKADNPKLNITAAETMRVNVNLDNQTSRIVAFENIIRIQNNLQELDVVFDLAAPNDQYIQNQLQTYSLEERGREALNLMLYGIYTGPGTSSSGSVANNTLNNFIEKELNQWSRKYLGDLGITFGIDTYSHIGAGGDEQSRTDLSYQFSHQLFNDRINLKIGGRIASDSDPAEGTEQNIVDDIILEYYLNKKRTWLLKGFRHTGYESVLEGEITQTGGGIVFRRNFRKLWDVFRKNDY